ncbi:unnamed protein product [Closterium sp. Yama58-4]|nr:unnamed protein product [Closterium sp. Yama58-4]
MTSKSFLSSSPRTSTPSFPPFFPPNPPPIFPLSPPSPPPSPLLLSVSPLSPSPSLHQVASGICDNLLTCIVRAWDFGKPLLLAPAMNTHMWTSPFTARHVAILEGLGAELVSPISKRLACGDVGTGAMAEPASIEAAVRQAIAAIRQAIAAIRAEKRQALEAGPSKP